MSLLDALKQLSALRVVGGEAAPVLPAEYLRLLAQAERERPQEEVTSVARLEPIAPLQGIAQQAPGGEKAVPLRIGGITESSRPRPAIADVIAALERERSGVEAEEIRRVLKSIADPTPDKTLDDLGYGYAERATKVSKSALTIAEVHSLARKYAQQGLSFLVWIASILDKPRAAAAGLLAGEPSHLLLLLPFSEGYLKGFYENLVRVFIPSFKGIPERRIYGRDLLEMWGVVPRRSGTGILFGGSISDLVGDVLGLALDFMLGSIVPYPAIVSTGSKAKTLLKGAGSLEAEAAAHAQLVARKLIGSPDMWDDLLRSGFADIAVLRHVPLPLESPAVRQGLVGKILRQAASRLRGLEYLSRFDPAVARQAYVRQLVSMTDDTISGEIAKALARERVLPTATPLEAIREATSGRRALVLAPGWPFDRIIGRQYYLKLWEPKGEVAKKVRNIAEALLIDNPVSSFVLGLFHWSARGVSRGAVSMAMDATENARLIRSVLTDMQAEVNSALGALAGHWQAFAENARFFGDSYAGLTFDSMARYAAETALVWSQNLDDSSRVIARQLLGVASEQDLQRAATIIGETVNALHGVHLRLQNKLLQVLKENGAPVSAREDLFGLFHFTRFGRGIFHGQTVWPTKRIALLSHPAGTVALNRMSADPILNARINAAARIVYHDGFHVGTPAMLRVGSQEIPAVLEMLVEGDAGVGALRFWDGKRYYYALVPGVELTEKSSLLLRGARHVDDYRFVAEPPVGVKLPRVFTTPKAAETSARRYAQAAGWQIPEKVDPVVFYAYKRYFEPIVELPEWRRAIHPIVGVPNEELLPLIFPIDKAAKQRAIEIVRRFPKLQEALGLTTLSQVRRFVSGGGMVGELVDVLRRVGPADELLYNRSLSETLEELYYYASQRLGLLVASQDYVARTASLQPRATLTSLMTSAFEQEAGMIPLAEVRKRIHWWHEPKAKAGGLPLTDAWTRRVIDRWLERNGKTLKELVPEAATPEDAYRILAEQLYVPEFVPKQINRVFHLRDPKSKAIHDYEKLWNWYLTTMRYWLTQISPAFHVRNFVSGQVMNLTATDVPYTMKQYAAAFRDVAKALSGRRKLPFDEEMAAVGILKGVVLAADPEAAVTTARGGLGWVFQPMTTDLAKRVLWPSTKMSAPAKHAAEVQKRVLEGRTLGALTGEFAAALRSTTDRAYTLVETLNRAVPYVAARRAGLSPAQAAELVKRIQYDYSRLSPFEQRVMRPLFLFYGWQRSNLGYLIPRVTLEATSGAASLVRLLYAAQQTAGDLPAWMAEAAAIPLRQTEREKELGITTVVRRWGLHIEDLGLIHPSIVGPGALRMMQKIISSMNPIVGAAVRLSTGIEPYTGRPLKEQAGLTGYPLLDVVLGITPLARVGAMLRTTAEVFGYSPYRRTWQLQVKFAPLLDLLTGIKTGEYDLELQLLMDAREQLRRQLEGSPYTRSGGYIYIPEHLKPIAPEWLLATLDRYNQISKQARQVARERRGRDIVAIRELVTGGD